MKSILVVILCLGLIYSQQFETLSVELHDYVNSVQQEWIAGENDYFSDKDSSFVKNLLGTYLTEGPSDSSLMKVEHDLTESLPESFDSRE